MLKNKNIGFKFDFTVANSISDIKRNIILIVEERQSTNEKDVLHSFKMQDYQNVKDAYSAALEKCQEVKDNQTSKDIKVRIIEIGSVEDLKSQGFSLSQIRKIKKQFKIPKKLFPTKK